MQFVIQNLRVLLAMLMCVAAMTAFGQEVGEPTTATDGDVKIHKTHRFSMFRRSKVHTTEREGKSLKKPKRRPNWDQKKVFKHQSALMKKQLMARKRARGSKRQYVSSK